MSVISAVAVDCPVCGAPVGNSLDRCQYCGSFLFLRVDLPKISPESLNRGALSENIAKFRTDLRQNPNDEAAHYGLGVAYFNMLLYDDAVRELEEAARITPENPNVQTQLAVALREQAREGNRSALDKAHDRIKLALRLDPKNTEAILLKATMLAEKHDNAAYSQFREAIALDPDRATPLAIESVQAMAKHLSRNRPPLQISAKANYDDAKQAWRFLAEISPNQTTDQLIEFIESDRAALPAPTNPLVGKLHPSKQLEDLPAIKSLLARRNRETLAPPSNPTPMTAEKPAQFSESQSSSLASSAPTARSRTRAIVLGILIWIGYVFVSIILLGSLINRVPGDVLPGLLILLLFISWFVTLVLFPLKLWRKDSARHIAQPAQRSHTRPAPRAAKQKTAPLENPLSKHDQRVLVKLGLRNDSDPRTLFEAVLQIFDKYVTARTLWESAQIK